MLSSAKEFLALLHRVSVFSVRDKMIVILWTAVTAQTLVKFFHAGVWSTVTAHVVYVFPCSLNLTR